MQRRDILQLLKANLESSLPRVPPSVRNIVTGYLIHPSELVCSIYHDSRMSEEEKDQAIAQTCLSLLREQKQNGVANALSELSQKEQEGLLKRWQKRGEEDDTYRLLVVYFMPINRIDLNESIELERKIETPQEVEHDLPPALLHAVKIKIKLFYLEDVGALIRESSLHLNLNSARIVYSSIGNNDEKKGGEKLDLSQTCLANIEFDDVGQFYNVNIKDADLRGAITNFILAEDDHILFDTFSEAKGGLDLRSFNTSNRRSKRPTALHQAAETNQFSFVRKLIQAGASQDELNSLGEKPLHSALRGVTTCDFQDGGWRKLDLNTDQFQSFRELIQCRKERLGDHDLKKIEEQLSGLRFTYALNMGLKIGAFIFSGVCAFIPDFVVIKFLLAPLIVSKAELLLFAVIGLSFTFIALAALYVTFKIIIPYYIAARKLESQVLDFVKQHPSKKPEVAPAVQESKVVEPSPTTAPRFEMQRCPSASGTNLASFALLAHPENKRHTDQRTSLQQRRSP